MGMTRKQNIWLAKRMFADLVYNTAYIEGVNVTFPQAQTIIDGGVVNNVAADDIQTVLNLKAGWQYIINHVDEPLNLEYVCKINDYVSREESLEWGVLRTGRVGVSGTDYLPAVPVQETVKAELERINEIRDPAERALEYFCYSVYAQLFWDGNKRTSTLVASKILIESGEGVLTIGKRKELAFNEGLLHLYNTGEKEPMKEALRDCIMSLERYQQQEPVQQQPEQEEDIKLDR